MKRSISAGLCVLLLLCLLTGCTAKSNVSDTGNGTVNGSTESSITPDNSTRPNTGTNSSEDREDRSDTSHTPDNDLNPNNPSNSVAEDVPDTGTSDIGDVADDVITGAGDAVKDAGRAIRRAVRSRN